MALLVLAPHLVNTSTYRVRDRDRLSVRVMIRIRVKVSGGLVIANMR